MYEFELVFRGALADIHDSVNAHEYAKGDWQRVLLVSTKTKPYRKWVTKTL